MLKASHNGHWHDAEVKIHGDQLILAVRKLSEDEHEDDIGDAP